MLTLQAVEHGILYLAVFLAPFALLRFSDLFFTVSDFLFCISLIFLIIAGRINTSPLYSATPLWLIAFALLFAGLVLGTLLNGDVRRGMIVIIQYFFSYIVLLTILVRYDFALMHRIAAVFVASMLVVDIHGIITFYTVGYVESETKGVVSGGQRLSTVLLNPNGAAAMNALAMPLLLYFWSTGRLKTIFAFPAVIVFLVTVVLTSSNSGLIVMAACLAVFTAFIITPRLFLRLTIAGGLATVLFLAAGGTDLLPSAFQKRVLNAVSSGDISEAGTYVARFDLITEAITIISDKGIVLIGLGADHLREISALTAPVHNLYLLLWVEGGLLALIGWMLFSLVGVQICFAVWKAGAPKQLLAAIAATVTVFLMVALFRPHMYARWWVLPLLIVYGLGIAHLRRSPVD